MKTKITSVLCPIVLLATLACEFTARAASPPVVNNVTAGQRANTKLVDIAYTISDADSATVNIFILVSKDSGATWDVPAHTFTGPQGPNVSVSSTPTTKNVVWDAGADWDGQFTEHCRVRVLANDAGLVLIPAGSYLRGNPPALNDSDITDAPQYSVSVSAFYMESTPVTGGRWNLVKTGFADPHGYVFAHAGAFKAALHPVHSIDWYDAVKWCNARSEMEGLTPVYYTDSAFTGVYRMGEVAPYVKPGANGYRLPTEAEWEKAARGGASGHRFPWSDVDTIQHTRANYIASTSNLYDTSLTQGYHPTYATGGTPYTSPVGSFAANGYGLYDMAGNVRQWCWDWYSSTYYAASQTDPQGPGGGSNRVWRGGDWADFAPISRTAFRLSTAPTDSNIEQSFRCARGF
jgi:formylglycine-generating enzyme